jgi:hypothetical protein
MPTSPSEANAIFGEALLAVRKILDSDHALATPGEKVTRVAWVIGNLPTEIRETVITEAQNRVILGWASGQKPTDW